MAIHIIEMNPSVTVGDCLERGWKLVLHCVCGRQGSLSRQELLRLPAEATVSQIAENATCAICGVKEGRMYPRQGWRAHLPGEVKPTY
jgi:hypothetical protein